MYTLDCIFSWQTLRNEHFSRNNSRNEKHTPNRVSHTSYPRREERRKEKQNTRRKVADGGVIWIIQYRESLWIKRSDVNSSKKARKKCFTSARTKDVLHNVINFNRVQEVEAVVEKAWREFCHPVNAAYEKIIILVKVPTESDNGSRHNWPIVIEAQFHFTFVTRWTAGQRSHVRAEEKPDFYRDSGGKKRNGYTTATKYKARLKRSSLFIKRPQVQRNGTYLRHRLLKLCSVY